MASLIRRLLLQGGRRLHTLAPPLRSAASHAAQPWAAAAPLQRAALQRAARVPGRGWAAAGSLGSPSKAGTLLRAVTTRAGMVSKAGPLELSKAPTRAASMGAAQAWARAFLASFKLQRGGGGPLGGGLQRWIPGRGANSDEQAVWTLIAANVAVYGAWQVFNPSFMAHHFMVSGESIGSLRLHTALTSAFSHQSFSHLGFNMMGLYFFGIEMARLLGGQQLIWLYCTAGLAGSAAQVLWHSYPTLQKYGRWNYWSPPCLGASGAVDAIVVLSCLLFPSRTILLYFVVPVPAALLGGLFVARDFVGLVRGGSGEGHAAHLGGAAVGALYWAAMSRRRFR